MEEEGRKKRSRGNDNDENVDGMDTELSKEQVEPPLKKKRKKRTSDGDEQPAILPTPPPGRPPLPPERRQPQERRQTNNPQTNNPVTQDDAVVVRPQVTAPENQMKEFVYLRAYKVEDTYRAFDAMNLVEVGFPTSNSTSTATCIRNTKCCCNADRQIHVLAGLTVMKYHGRNKTKYLGTPLSELLRERAKSLTGSELEQLQLVLLEGKHSIGKGAGAVPKQVTFLHSQVATDDDTDAESAQAGVDSEVLLAKQWKAKLAKILFATMKNLPEMNGEVLYKPATGFLVYVLRILQRGKHLEDVVTKVFNGQVFPDQPTICPARNISSLAELVVGSLFCGPDNLLKQMASEAAAQYDLVEKRIPSQPPELCEAIYRAIDPSIQGTHQPLSTLMYHFFSGLTTINPDGTENQQVPSQKARPITSDGSSANSEEVSATSSFDYNKIVAYKKSFSDAEENFKNQITNMVAVVQQDIAQHPNSGYEAALPTVGLAAAAAGLAPATKESPEEEDHDVDDADGGPWEGHAPHPAKVFSRQHLCMNQVVRKALSFSRGSAGDDDLKELDKPCTTPGDVTARAGAGNCLSLGEIKITGFLGTGANTKAYKAVCRGMRVALKLSTLDAGEFMREAYRDLIYTALIGNESTMRPLGYFFFKPPDVGSMKANDKLHFFVVEELGDITLHDLIEETNLKHPSPKSPQGLRKKFVREWKGCLENRLDDIVGPMEMLLESLVKVHAKEEKIAHRDIKPQNLFKVGRLWKFGDWGSVKSQAHQGGLKETMNRGTKQYSSREALYDGKYNQADEYAYGISLYEAVVGEDAPIEHLNGNEWLDRTGCPSEYVFAYEQEGSVQSNRIGPLFKNLIMGLTENNLEVRLSSRDALGRLKEIKEFHEASKRNRTS